MSIANDEFAQWLEATHPDVFEALYAHALRARTALSGLGDDLDLSDVTSSLDASLDNISFSAGTDIDASLALQDLNFGPADSIGPADGSFSTPSVAASPTGTSSSGGVMNALSSIGSWLTSSSGLNAIANIGTAVLKTQGAIDVAHAQTAVIQAQAARAQAGQSPAPISYTRDAAGNLVPVYNTNTPQGMPPELQYAVQQGRAHQVVLADGSIGYTLDSSTLSSVLSTGMPWWVWLLLGGAFLFALSQRG